MEYIRACIRIKPTLGNENEEIICGKYDETSVVNFKTHEKYNFEQVFDDKSSTEGIFERIGQPLIQNCFEGVNVCVFVYGQTCSGKTHTMKGNNEAPGFIPMALRSIFKKINENADQYSEIRCSYIEIYNENVNDLLNPSNVNLDIRENLIKGVHIPNLTEAVVKTHQEAMKFFETGESARKFGGTSLNEHSSRSHTIFRVGFETRKQDKSDKIIFSTLNLIDLAGSEAVSKAKTEGLRKKEGVNINKSLLALSNVISKLATRDCNYINYRDSKLTRLLQPCLGGNSRTVVICTINPLLQNYQETLNTLKFAINAGAIKNQVEINEKIASAKNSLSKEQITEYNELKASISKSKEFFDSMLTSHVIKTEELELKISYLQNDNDRLNNQYLGQQKELLYYFNSCEEKDEDICLLKREKQTLLEAINTLKVQHHQELEKKTDDFEKETTLLFAKIEELVQENQQLKDTNSKPLFDKEAFEQIKANSELEIERLVKSSNEQIALLQKKIETLSVELQKKSSVSKDQNFTQYPRSCDGNQSSIFSSESDLFNVKIEFDPKPCDLESYLRTHLVQKHRQLMTMNIRCSDMRKELIRRDDRIFELENQIIFLKTQVVSRNKENRNMEEFEELRKRVKLEHNAFSQVTNQQFEDLDELRREVKYLELKNKNFERQLNKKKQTEEEDLKSLRDLTNNQLELENQLTQNLPMFDRSF